MQDENNIFNATRLDVSRSTFHHKCTSSGTMNAGRLVPIRTFWVQPGDSISMNVQDLFKMSTPVYPTMDNLYADIFFFFVPHKLVLGRRYGTPSVNDGNTSWAAIVGAQDNLLNMPIPANGVKAPVLLMKSDVTSYAPGTLMDYFPVWYGSNHSERLNALPLLSYFAIWNENFRDPNLMYPVTWNLSTSAAGNTYVSPSGNVLIYANYTELVESYRSPSVETDYLLVNALASDKNPASSATHNCNYWLPFPVCRFHGYFGSGLPWPQRNSAGVLLPLGDKAPIIGVGTTTHAGKDPFLIDSGVTEHTGTQKFVTQFDTEGIGAYWSYSDAGNAPGAVKSNLYADLSAATAANVNALRMAIQQQRWYEKLARSGNRYDELEYGLFGVRPHDSGDDRPKYLGGKRVPLKIEMVASTNGGGDTSSAEGSGSLGSLGAFSHTNDADHFFYDSFDDWGIVMCVACVRHHDTFGSGTDRFWLKRTREDLYFPTFAHLGEQAVGDHELINKPDDGTVFAYMPAWSEYRNELDRVSGLLRPGENLDFMTYARDFGSGTTLAEFLNASSQVATVDKTLAVGSNASGFQFVYQFTFDMTIRRAMPTDSIPGLMDHF